MLCTIFCKYFQLDNSWCICPFLQFCCFDSEVGNGESQLTDSPDRNIITQHFESQVVAGLLDIPGKAWCAVIASAGFANKDEMVTTTLSFFN